MRSKNQIDKTIRLADLLHNGRLLHHATAQSDHHMRIFLLIIGQIPQSSIYLIVRILTNGTGIIDHEIRMLVFRLDISNIRQNSDKLLRISGIHLTPESLSKKGHGTSQFFGFFLYPGTGFRHKIELSVRLKFRRWLTYVYRVKI